VSLRKEWAKMQAVPVKDRADWIASAAGMEALEDVEYARREDSGIDIDDDDDTPAPRVRLICPKRPKGVRQNIIAEVARETGVSIWIVERAWKAFRRLEAKEV